MEAQTAPSSESVRINKEILAKIRYIAPKRGQTIMGYINTNLEKIVERDFAKFDNAKNHI